MPASRDASSVRHLAVGGRRIATILLDPICLGLVAVLAFSLTAAASRQASLAFGGLTAGWWRIALGGLLAVAILLLRRDPWPSVAQWRALVPVMVGVGLGFPLLLSSAMALPGTSASHGAVVIGLLPLTTAALGSFWSGEALGWRFWLASAIGTAVVVGEALARNRGSAAGLGDVLLLGAVLVGALGYVSGARLSRTMAGWRVICWAVAGVLPISLPSALAISGWDLPVPLLSSPAALADIAWPALLWLSWVSQVLGFFPWYRALAQGGIARISQVQMLQPGLSVLWAWLLLGERPQPGTIAALVVVMMVLGVCLRRRAIHAAVLSAGSLRTAR